MTNLRLNFGSGGIGRERILGRCEMDVVQYGGRRVVVMLDEVDDAVGIRGETSWSKGEAAVEVTETETGTEGRRTHLAGR